MVDMPQGFLPLATAAQGQTLYDRIAQSKFGPGDIRKQYKAPICESEDRGLCGERPPKGESLAIGAQRS